MLGYMRSQKNGQASEPKVGFTHKKSLGQNFLTSDVVPKWLCDAGNLSPGDTVLEIGPGTGRLTKELLARDLVVKAVEADIRAIEHLNEDFAEVIAREQLTVYHGDAREITPETLLLEDKKFAVIANIPYYLSGHILRQLLDTKVQPHTLVLLMQKELVARIARDQKSSLLSLSVRAFGEPFYVKSVNRGHFHPAPKVDSAILAVRNINHSRLEGIAPEDFFALLHLGLGSKRKQLVGNLSKSYPRTKILEALKQIDKPVDVRGEDLQLEDWIKLAIFITS
jgi:16S rRNA (adenine1518-N6/adenine1519-N6)-dimethyltransferase